MSLNERIAELSEVFDGMLGVAVKHLDGGESASLNGDELFPTASVFKVPVIVELYRQVEERILSLDEKVILREEDKVPGSGILKELSPGLSVSLLDLAALMMIVSDNTATDLVVEKVGKENINATLQRLGLERTVVVVDCRDVLFDLVDLNDLPDEEKNISLFEAKARETSIGGSWSLGVEENNVATATEMLRLLEMIVDGRAVSRQSCDAILETMRRCQTGGYRITKYLPLDRVEFAHKTGSLPGIRNDAGIVTLIDSGERYIISCFTRKAADNFAAEETIAQVSKGVYDYFTS
jgi:beta-lactamase class A